MLGGEAFERQLGHEDVALMNGIRTLMKGAPESSLILFLLREGTMRNQWSAT